ncbi:ComEA family DNA-binding protein [Nocardioides rubriscoriae]|uniref:ComEA family DNA-binding protein n=1 Tax=Nocardioides rubriscoriae TaxID=642762 RepID=UPI001B878DAB|nr:ComEA family DNA-binding protein [Nocardioides rubriscoriae]
MRSRRPSPEHQEAVSRRLALLSEQLAAARDEAPAVGDEWWGEHTRIAPLRPALHVVSEPRGEPGLEPEPDTWDVPTPAGPPAVSPQPVVVREPGRHAHRRGLAWSSLLPETLRGRVGLAPGPVAVVALLVAVALAWTCWQVVRDDPEPAVPVAAPVAAGAATAGDLVPVDGVPTTVATVPGGPAAPAGGGTVTVDVAGRVRRPGIVVLEAGSRVVDALAEAGGARPTVDLTTLNLARPLVDGEQILVGVPGAAAPPPAVAGTSGSAGGDRGSSAPAAPAAPAALVDLNLADQTQLEGLPEVGPVTAAAIVSWREEHGGFTAITELLEVDGIGEATLARLTPLVTV